MGVTVSPRIAVIVAAAAAATLTAPSAAAAQDVPAPAVLSVEQYETPIDGWSGWLVWSRRGADGRYSLVARTPEGRGIALPVEPQPTPIDASIGPGPDGKPLIVYTRCAVPGVQPRGCDVHRIDPQTGNGGRVAAAAHPQREERFPTVWGSRIAFSLASSRTPGQAGVAVANLNGSPPRRATLHGPRTERVGGRTVPLSAYGPRGIDLRDGRLAFSWQAQGKAETWSLFATNAKGTAPRRLLHARTTSTVVSQIGRPAVGARDVVAPLQRTGSLNSSTIVRSTFTGSRQWGLRDGFSAAQTERYGSALTAVARSDDRDLVVVRRLASDGRWACVAPTTVGATPVVGCELLRYADATRAWTRLPSGSSR